MTASSTTRIATMAVRVRCAVFTTGSRNACTPLLTASTPVIAVQPLENALSSSHAPIIVCGGLCGGGPNPGGGAAPPAHAPAGPGRGGGGPGRPKKQEGEM